MRNLNYDGISMQAPSGAHIDMQQGRPWPVVLAHKGMVNTGSSKPMSVGNQPDFENENSETALRMSGLHGVSTCKRVPLN